MYKIFIPVLLLISLSASAQYEKVDSLKFSLLEGSPDSIKIKTYLGLSNVYQPISRDTCMLYNQMAYDLAVKNNLARYQFDAKRNMGEVYYNKGDFKNSLESFTIAMEIGTALSDSNYLCITNNWFGLVYWSRGENEIAIKYFQDSYALAEKMNDEERLTMILNNLGLMSAENNRFKEARDYFRQTAKLSRKIGDNIGLGLAYLNLAVTNMAVDSLAEAIRDLEIAKKFFEKENDFYNIGLVYINMADVYLIQGKYEKSIQYANKGLQISRKEKLLELEVFCLETKSSALKLNKQYELAFDVATEGLTKAKLIGTLKKNITFFEILADASAGIRNYEQAFFWQKKYTQTKDSIFTKEKQNEISQLEISFQSNQKDVENEKLKTEKERQALIIDQQARMSVAYCAIVLLLMGFLFLLYLAKRKTKSMNKALSEKVKERTDELEIINSQLLQSNDELKSFAFISSHDLKEPLRNIGGFISLIKKRIKQKKYDDLAEYISYVEKGNIQLNQLVDSIREYSKIGSFANHPMEVVDLNDCVDYIISYLSDEISNRKAKISFDPLPKIYYNQSIIIILLQKLIENGLKYNQNPYPVIRIYHEIFQNKLKITVADNGLGIDPKYQDKIFDLFVRLHNRKDYSGSGMGLAFCKKLLLNSGGSIHVNSKVGKGSQFIITLPANIVNADSKAGLLNSSEKDPHLSNNN